MNLIFSILRATHASGTHHKLALDALRHLDGGEGPAWQRMLLRHGEIYLQGSKAPDKEFKDFQNHVLHVRDNLWGGAPAKAANWYGHLVAALREENWEEAAWCAGVLSHYYTDPLMPFHTAQSEAENAIHRATEWSISKSYDLIWRDARDKCEAMSLLIPGDDASIEDLVIAGARMSNRYYEKLIAHYDINRGVSDPIEGLDKVSRRFLGELIAYASVGFASLLKRAFREAAVSPPVVSLSAATLLAALKVPLRWVTNRIEDAGERELVRQIYFELQETGTVEKMLPEDDRLVRDLYVKEVLGLGSAQAGRISATGDSLPAPMAALKAKPTGVAASSPSTALAQGEQARTKFALADKLVARADAARQEPLVSAQQAEVRPAPAATPDATTGNPASVSTSVAQALSPAENARQGGGAAAAPASATAKGTAQGTTQRTAVGTGAGPASANYRLSPASPVADAPSIGPKTAVRLQRIGITSVGDLLAADPDTIAAAVKVHYFTGQTLRDWQDQARLACSIPELSGKAAQFLVGVGLRTAEAVAAADIDVLTRQIEAFAATPEGERLLRFGDSAPARERIGSWIERAKTGRRQLAA